MKAGRLAVHHARREGPKVHFSAPKKAGDISSFRQEFSNYLASFRETVSIKAMLVASIELGFYILFFFILSLSLYFLNRISKPLENVNPAELMSSSTDALGQYNSTISKVVIFIIFALAMFAILTFIAFTATRYLIWSVLLNKRPKLKLALKFFLLNIILLIAILVLGFLITLPLGGFGSSNLSALTMMALALSAVLLLFGMIALYFTYILYYVFTERGLIFNSFKNSALISAKMFRHFWIPLLLAMLTFLIVTLVSWLSNYMPNIASQIFLGALSLAFLTWIKIYLSSVLVRQVRRYWIF